jgi:hypothetical protein
MVFCSTRKNTVSTAKLLTNWWTSSNANARYWNSPGSLLQLLDDDLICKSFTEIQRRLFADLQQLASPQASLSIMQAWMPEIELLLRVGISKVI